MSSYLDQLFCLRLQLPSFPVRLKESFSVSDDNMVVKNSVSDDNSSSFQAHLTGGFSVSDDLCRGADALRRPEKGKVYSWVYCRLRQKTPMSRKFEQSSGAWRKWGAGGAQCSSVSNIVI
jgi:hypothetical protein